MGDVDGDGKKEIIIASGNSFVVFKWRGGRFERIHISAAMEVEITDITIGDLTGDLVDEIVIVVGRTKILIYKIQGGSLILITERVSRTSLQVRIGSVIRHHQKQLVTLEHVAGSGGDKLTLFILTNGQLEIVIEETIGMKADVLLGVKDVDNDFMDEIIISTSNRRRLLVLGVSGQSLARKWLSHGFSGVIEDVEVADWDKDGRPEIFVAVGAQVHVYKLRGRDFVLVKQIDMEVYVVSFAKGDVEKDGYIEVIVISKTGVIIIVKDFFEAKSQFLVQQTVHIPKNLPPAIKVAEVKVDKVIIFRKEAIKGKIIISGKFLVNILYVAEPDRRVFAIDAEIPFTHFVPVPGLLPKSPDYNEYIIECCKKILSQTRGRAFILFTSYSSLNYCYDKMHGWLGEEGLSPMAQGRGISPFRLLEQFKQADSPVLFGTSSFWEGMDVPGDKLTCVIVTRLPFAVPSHPLEAARMNKLKDMGKNDFLEYSVPKAVIKFKQGFGRLIRSKNDKGVVVVLDTRIKLNTYGKYFLNSLPDVSISNYLSEISRFLLNDTN